MQWVPQRKIAAVLACLVTASALAAGPESQTAFSLDDYLGQVRGKNEAFRGAVEASQAAKDRREEKDVPLAPTLFASARVSTDGKLPQLPFFTYDRLNMQNYALGVSQLTSFGLLAKVSYQLDSIAFKNAILPGGTGGAVPLSYYDARPVLEVTLPLWGNGFGSTVRAARDLTDASQAANQFANRYAARMTLAQAEQTFWRLVVAREVVLLEEKSLGESKKIHDWTSRRAKLNLADDADDLQAKAALELHRLSLKQAQDEERTAARAFNAFRNSASDQVPEKLPRLDNDELKSIAVPNRAPSRDDVEAARQQAKATAAATALAEEKNRPTLDLSGSLALNGRDTSVSDALGNSYSANRPTASLGLLFQMPLDFSATSAARRGAALERDAATKTLKQRELDQDSSWTDLSRRLAEAKERLVLTRTIEEAQDAKLENERKRLKNGRTTTYQVLLFEQDFAQSRLARLRAQAEVIGVVAQMRLFSAEAP